MGNFRANKAILLFTLAWFVLSLLQAYFTEIIEDEAYYWLYSQFPAWGYFDHPPMVAMLIRLGYSIIPNTLGVRILTSLMGAGSIYILWLLIPERSRDSRMFMWSVFAISLMHLNVAGFIALPDVPLVFFTSLFFLVLRKYLEEDRMKQALLLGFLVAGMMYSKYHALLILFFTLLSNWKLFLRRSFWVIVLLATILYLPHLVWEYRNDFVSFQYHLISRNDPFQPRQILEYLGNQLLVTGPFIGAILLYLAFIRRVSGPYERMLKYNLVGFFGFFLVSSIRGHVEPHWTAAAFPPMVVLAMINLKAHPGFRKWISILGIASVPVILVIRAYLVWDFLPIPDNVSRMFHGKATWAAQIAEVAGDRPVVFSNKYQFPSVYWYYTGKKAYTRNDMLYRRNQFDIWPLESELEGQRVLFSFWGHNDSIRHVPTVLGDFPYLEIERWCSFNRLNIKILEKKPEAGAGMPFSIPVRISNPTSLPVSLDRECDQSPLLMYGFLSRDREIRYGKVDPQPVFGSLQPGEEVTLELPLVAPDEPGTYRLIIAFGSKLLLPGINGRPAELTVISPPVQ